MSRSDFKKIHKNSIIGQRGINLIERKVLEMGYVWYPSGGVEAGIDGVIEIRDSNTGDVYNAIIQVQSKATERPFQAETPEGFDYLCDERDLNYWLQGNAPVILIVSRPDTEEIYWVSIKDYFRDLSLRKARKVHFDKQQDRFDQACRSTLASLAIPQDIGVYLSPRPMQEKLWSNLLEVTYFPKKIYVAYTNFHSPDELRAELESREIKGCREWILKNKQIISFYNLEEYPWRDFCDIGTCDCFDISEWAYTEDTDRKREFVWLLNQALRSKVWPVILYNSEKKCYYVRATPNLSPRTFAYKSLVNRSKKTVFRGYQSKNDPKRIAYYRHFAFEGQFRHLEGRWYLEITPTYYFTSNGCSLYTYFEETLKGIKLLEHNPQVLSQVIMWADYLSRPADLFTSRPRFLEFGHLMSFSLDSGIDEKGWLRHEEDNKMAGAQSVLEELGLFEL